MPANDGDGRNGEPAPTPEYPFTLIGDAVRVAILRALGDVSVKNLAYTELSYSDLRSRIDADVADSQFNYHLQQLTGHFITKGDDGYHLRPEGLQLYRTIRAGLYHKRQDSLSVDAGFDCHYCETPVKASFDSGFVSVKCPECETTFHYDIAMAIPPESFEDEAAAFAQYSTYAHHKILGWARNVCQTCGNTMERTFLRPDQLPSGGHLGSKVRINQLCAHCSASGYLTVGMLLLPDSGLVSFCHDHDVDVLSTPYWELPFAATDNYVTVRSTDPWEVALAITYGEETLELVVDEDGIVVERNHR